MKTYTYSDFAVTNDTNTLITEDKLWIDLFNDRVSDIFRQIALKKINQYVTEHQELTFDKSDILICILQVYMVQSKPLDEKFSILIFIENEAKELEKDCIINISLQPHESYFTELRKIILEELEQLIFF